MVLWRDMLDYAKQLVMLKEQTQKNTTDIKEMRQELKDLIAAVQRLAYEVKIDRETAARDRENIALRLENQLLRFERRLHPPAPQQASKPILRQIFPTTGAVR